jgi:hypothetical protein
MAMGRMICIPDDHFLLAWWPVTALRPGGSGFDSQPDQTKVKDLYEIDKLCFPVWHSTIKVSKVAE